MPFIICQNIHCKQIIYGLAGKLFMSGVRPIEIIIQYALSEQAPTSILHNHFCMAELLQILLQDNFFAVHTAIKYEIVR